MAAAIGLPQRSMRRRSTFQRWLISKAWASVMPRSCAPTKSLMSPPATKLAALPEVSTAPVMAGSVATRSSAAISSAISSGDVTFIGRVGSSSVISAMPSASTVRVTIGSGAAMQAALSC